MGQSKKTLKQQLEANVWKYVLILIANKRMFASIMTVYFLLAPDVDARGLGILLLIGQVAGFILEIPSGYVSDKLGHKRAIVLARIFLIVSDVLFIACNGLYGFALASVFLSAGSAFMSGTMSAFMHETLRALGKENQYASIIGKARSIGFGVPAVLMAGLPFLIVYSFKLPFIIVLILDVISLLVACSLTHPPVSPEEVKEVGVTNFFQVLQEGYRYGFFRFALFSGAITGFFVCRRKFSRTVSRSCRSTNCLVRCLHGYRETRRFCLVVV